MEEVAEFKNKSIEILARAKMELRQWEWTSGEEFGVGLLPNSERGLSSSGGILSDGGGFISSVLGLKWDRFTDTLNCEIPVRPPEEPVTKRSILSTIAKTFDPLGILCPALLIPKILLQKYWVKKKTWDEEADEQVKQEFLKWCKEAHHLEDIKIPRHAFPGINEAWSIQLHTFCDASKDAYAATVFVRVEGAQGPTVHLLQAKSRGAPLKKSTIPRLELMGCLIGARLTRSVVESLDLQNTPCNYWTDSTVALAWIQRNNEWGTYVGNRVKEINVLSDPSAWKHIPGEFNPADLPSRGCNLYQLLQSRWWEGPSWLKRSIETWPVAASIVDEEVVSAEMKKSAMTAATQTLSSARKQIPWYIRSSEYQTNLRIFAWILRFIKPCGKEYNNSGSLTVKEINEAEMKIFKLVQIECFPKDEDCLCGVRVTKSTDGIYRVHTKLLRRQDTEEFKSPIILPSDHPLVHQLVRDEHSNNCHAGAQFLVSRLRERVWVIKSRRTIKSVIAKCVRCQRYAAKEVQVHPAPLPFDRVKDAAAFQTTGVDLAGPLFLKGGEKTWIVIFTCAVYRCVHMELVQSCSTEAFLMAFQKFCCRRGRPETIFSDNGTNFHGADNLFRPLDWKRIEEYAATKRIQWRFNPPSASWWGGFWERLIRSAKHLLRKMLGHKKLNFNSLESCICEVESVMNSRPLTYVSEDQEDLIPLTPEMFLHPLRHSSFPEQSEDEGASLRKKVKALGQLREELRSRFREEYLCQLVHRGKSKAVKDLRVGDIVLIGSDQKKRLLWPMGRIEELIPGLDGEVRVAKIRVKEGIITRPLQRLYPLEIPEVSQCPFIPPKIIKPPEELVTSPAKTSEVITRHGRHSVKPKRYGIDE